ncbi:hypothetical protein BT93_J1623 [Corymbia citriodora subsp. variegata]|nr:hypothetical protein BT93_J1623 [Corymbia citriodora subsp. variegata]
MAASDGRSYTMAAEAAVEIVSQKLEILLSRSECVECLPMETLVGDAKAKLAMIQEFFSTGDRPYESTEWSRRLLQTMYDTEDMLDEFHLKVARGREEALLVATRPLAALVHKYMLWRDLSNQVKAMKELCQDQYLTDKEARGDGKKEPDSSSSHGSAPWGGQKLARLTSFWDRQASMNFTCHKDKKMKIIEQIREEAKKIREEAKQEHVLGISIFGEEGSGKTFLARSVYREAMELGFDLCAWVHVSASADKQEFLFEILKQVDKLARDLMNFNEIKKMLRQKLATTKRFLIVLDDVQLPDEQLLRELLMIIPFPSQGHIITTTRYDMIARIMNTDGPGPVKLENLPSHNSDQGKEKESQNSDQGEEKESQKMLATKLHGVPHFTRLTKEEKDKVLNRFPALPLCISLLGGLLSNAGEKECAALVKSDFKMGLSDLLQLTYHRLPVHLKPCFIYMVLFPVASPIPTRRPVRLWLAEGLLDSHCCDRERKRTPEDVGERFILELADRNVIDVVSWRADGSPRACQMLTSLYDTIRPNAMSVGFLHMHTASKSRDRTSHDPTNQQQLLATPRERARLQWLAEHTNIVTNNRSGSFHDLNLSHVRSFLSFYQRRGRLTKDISTFLRKMMSKTDYCLLRLLDLEGVYKPSLQGVLHKLVLLRYLGLRSTVLDSIPSEKILKACSNNATALTQLQTLSGLVIGEVTVNLMTDHMNSLTKLKLFLQCLDTDTLGAAGRTVADWISLRLTNLQSLTFGVIQEVEPAEEAKPAEAKPKEEPKPTKESKPAPSQIGPLPELSLAEGHHDLFELYLLGQLNKPIWTQLLPVSLRVLTLSGLKVEIDMMAELGGLLKNLRTFRLLANSFLGTSLNFAKDGFPSLIILKIWQLPKLEVVVIEEGAMLHLKELEFRHLKRLATVEGINYYKELENIRVVFKKPASGFVDSLDKEKGEKTKLYKIEEIETHESTDDDDRYSIINLKHVIYVGC